MNVEIGTVAAQILIWEYLCLCFEYLFQIFVLVTLQWVTLVSPGVLGAAGALHPAPLFLVPDEPFTTFFLQDLALQDPILFLSLQMPLASAQLTFMNCRKPCLWPPHITRLYHPYPAGTVIMRWRPIVQPHSR